jgi:hypothetical protein
MTQTRISEIKTVGGCSFYQQQFRGGLSGGSPSPTRRGNKGEKNDSFFSKGERTDCTETGERENSVDYYA